MTFVQGVSGVPAITAAVDPSVLAEQALALAQAGVDAGQNARQMVLNRDPKLAALQAAADQLPISLAQAESEHTNLQSQIDALKAAVDALVSKATVAQQARVASAQLLSLGQVVDLPVVWPVAFADTNYVVLPLLDATGGLVNVQPPVEKAGTRTKTGVTVSVKTNAVLAGGITLNVVGLRFG